MKIAITFLLFGSLFSICNAWTNFGPHFDKTNFNGRENKLVDTFSLSFYGNLGMSRAVDGISKIIEGIVSCKLSVFLFKIYSPQNELKREKKSQFHMCLCCLGECMITSKTKIDIF